MYIEKNVIQTKIPKNEKYIPKHYITEKIRITSHYMTEQVV